MKSNKDKIVNGNNGVEAWFIPYDGENRCNRCYYAYSRRCKNAACSPPERDDGKIGYFRGAHQKSAPHDPTTWT